MSVGFNGAIPSILPADGCVWADRSPESWVPTGCRTPPAILAVRVRVNGVGVVPAVVQVRVDEVEEVRSSRSADQVAKSQRARPSAAEAALDMAALAGKATMAVTALAVRMARTVAALAERMALTVEALTEKMALTVAALTDDALTWEATTGDDALKREATTGSEMSYRSNRSKRTALVERKTCEAALMPAAVAALHKARLRWIGDEAAAICCCTLLMSVKTDVGEDGARSEKRKKAVGSYPTRVTTFEVEASQDEGPDGVAARGGHAREKSKALRNSDNVRRCPGHKTAFSHRTV